MFKPSAANVACCHGTTTFCMAFTQDLLEWQARTARRQQLVFAAVLQAADRNGDGRIAEEDPTLMLTPLTTTLVRFLIMFERCLGDASSSMGLAQEAGSVSRKRTVLGSRTRTPASFNARRMQRPVYRNGRGLHRAGGACSCWRGRSGVS